jgi:hypothetical protein
MALGIEMVIEREPNNVIIGFAISRHSVAVVESDI